MSALEKMIDEMIQTSWYSDEQRDKTLVSLTGRVSPILVIQLDIMAKDFNKSRSALVGDLLTGAITDAYHQYFDRHPEEGKAHLVEKYNHAVAAFYGIDPEDHHAFAVSQEDK